MLTEVTLELIVLPDTFCMTDLREDFITESDLLLFHRSVRFLVSGGHISKDSGSAVRMPNAN